MAEGSIKYWNSYLRNSQNIRNHLESFKWILDHRQEERINDSLKSLQTIFFHAL